MQAFLKVDNRFKSDAHRAAKEFGIEIEYQIYKTFSCYGRDLGMVTIHRTTDNRKLVCSFDRYWISCALLKNDQFDYDWDANERRMIASICGNAGIQTPWALGPTDEYCL